jgi:hypothetical protein
VRLFQLRTELLQPAGNPHRPAVIAEVSAYLAHDGRNRKSHELRTFVWVEAVHRVDQPYARHLDQVFQGFAAVAEAACDVVGQRQTAFDDYVSLPPILDRSLDQRRQTTKHVRDVGILRVRLRHQ